MTGPPDPNRDLSEGNSSPVDATIDATPAAPGPLFVDNGGNLHPGPATGTADPATFTGQPPATADPATVTGRPPATADPATFTGQPPATADPATFTGQPPATADPATFTGQPPATADPATVTGQPPATTADRAAPLPMTKTSLAAPAAPPWTGGRSPFAGGGLVATDSDLETTSMAQVPVRPFVALADRPAAVLGSGPAAVFPLPNEPTRAVMGTDVVTCPECGQLATVDMARRQADDFCRRCDFPLFWARGTVIAPEGAESGASLRRLPGTVGRAATAALICPHCSEPNSPAAEICVRCALSLHPVDIPEPEPVVIAPPVPEPEPEPLPERGFDWWWIVAIAAALIAIALLVGLLSLR